MKKQIKITYFSLEVKMFKFIFIIILICINSLWAEDNKKINIKLEIEKFLESKKISANPILNHNISHLNCINDVIIRDKFGDYKTLAKLINNYKNKKKLISKKINFGIKNFYKYDLNLNCEKYFKLVKRNF